LRPIAELRYLVPEIFSEGPAILARYSAKSKLVGYAIRVQHLLLEDSRAEGKLRFPDRFQQHICFVSTCFTGKEGLHGIRLLHVIEILLGVANMFAMLDGCLQFMGIMNI
jgi:hypothetical protein